MKMLVNLQFYSVQVGSHRFDCVRGEHIMHSFPLHMHDSLCIGLITDGQRILELASGRYMIEAGDMFLINRNEPHAIIGNSSYSYWVITVQGLDSSTEFFNNWGVDRIGVAFFFRINKIDCYR